MSEEEARPGFRARGEEALGELAQALVESPLFSQAVSRAFGAGERAFHAQRSALGALNVASGADVERVGQRLRSLSDRLEALEDQLDEMTDELRSLRGRLAEAERAPEDRPRAGSPKAEET